MENNQELQLDGAFAPRFPKSLLVASLFVSFSASLCNMPFLGLLSFLLIPLSLVMLVIAMKGCDEQSAIKLIMGTILMVASVFLSVYGAIYTSDQTATYLLKLQRASFLKQPLEFGFPLHGRVLWMGFIAPLTGMLSQILCWKNVTFFRVISVGLLLFSMFPCTLLLVYVISRVWPLSA